MGDPVVSQLLRLLQGLGGSEQEALRDGGECVQVVLCQAVLRADAHGAGVGSARLQPLHRQWAAFETISKFRTEGWHWRSGSHPDSLSRRGKRAHAAGTMRVSRTHCAAE